MFQLGGMCDEFLHYLEHETRVKDCDVMATGFGELELMKIRLYA